MIVIIDVVMSRMVSVIAMLVIVFGVMADMVVVVVGHCGSRCRSIGSGC